MKLSFQMLFLSILLCSPSRAQGKIVLDKPILKGKVSVEEAISNRKTTREFSNKNLLFKDISQILWASYGNIKRAETNRTKKVVPSAGGLYPLEIYLITGKSTVDKLTAGIYRYIAKEHALRLINKGDFRPELAKAALSQLWIAKAPAIVLIAGNYNRTKKKYGKRAKRYVHMEAGNSNQNIYLQSEALGLKNGTVGAFKDSVVKKLLSLPDGTSPLLIIPIGHQR